MIEVNDVLIVFVIDCFVMGVSGEWFELGWVFFVNVFITVSFIADEMDVESVVILIVINCF